MEQEKSFTGGGYDSPMSQLKVLVLAEDGRIRETAAGLPARFEVAFTTDMESALREVAKNGCDIAIVELALNGFAFAKDLPPIPGRQARLIMICERSEDRWLSHQAGAAQVLVKPLSDPSVLLEAIEAALADE